MPVLDIEDLNIKSGEATAILGANGTGKSTFLNILAGLDDCYSGDICYDGQQLNSDIAGRITLVFQRPLLLNTTVFKNIEYPLSIRKIDSKSRKEVVEHYLRLFNINHLRHKNALKLSGGESQKVALARALAFSPDVLLLDEPLSGVDFDSIPNLEQIIREFSKNGGTTVFVTHSEEQARRICNNIIYFKLYKNGSRWSY